MLPEHLSADLGVIYLIFNEGYSATAGDTLIRRPLCVEAIRLARALHELIPGEPEVIGLFALMLLHDSCRNTRTDDNATWFFWKVRIGTYGTRLRLTKALLSSNKP